MSNKVWMAVCEISVEPGDLPSGATNAFARITTWADSRDTMKEKVSRYLESYRWHLLAIESALPVDEGNTYDDETTEMITRTRSNPNAIILGRFFSYRES